MPFPSLRLLLFVCLAGLPLLGCATAGDPARPHHTDNGFRNVPPTEAPPVFKRLRWIWGNLLQSSQTGPVLPIAQNDPAFLRDNKDKTTLTWIGHASFLLQVKGKNILTDPHFSERASPVQWAGPKRMVPPGVALDELPQIDVVIISHDHFDSLDKRTIEQLHARPGGDNTVFFVPLKLKQWFTQRGIARVVELDWWEQHREGEITVTAVPAQHWSKRTLLSRNKTLWAGWVIQANAFRFLFAGDSGYGPHFGEIGRRLGPFDLAVIPIGAYEPRWMMAPNHISPEEAVQAHLDVHAKKSVAMHWGTFILTDEPVDEPPQRLRNALRERDVSLEAFVVPQHGQTLLLHGAVVGAERRGDGNPMR